jgi:hypothetical protein
MSWLAWLVVALVLAAAAAITGLQPKGARPVARTSLMNVGRSVLLVLAVIVAYFAYRARSGG